MRIFQDLCKLLKVPFWKFIAKAQTKEEICQYFSRQMILNISNTGYFHENCSATMFNFFAKFIWRCEVVVVEVIYHSSLDLTPKQWFFL